ncbi:DNA-binding FadR family transcriptional regulator [Burkholderia ambifaria]|nr:hypothetical protein [Burkholderia ambifaria]MDR6503535.1 DNA-binding FadR family transcriptional regulator [Burkholderia ambifaria]
MNLLHHGANDGVVESLLTLSKHVLGAAARMPHQNPFMQKHLEILDVLAPGQTAQAQKALRLHLENSCQKVIDRVSQVQQRVPPRNWFISADGSPSPASEQ